MSYQPMGDIDFGEFSSLPNFADGIVSSPAGTEVKKVEFTVSTVQR